MAVWYDDALRLRDFARSLEDAEYADSDDVLRKPYRFDEEYAVWKANNCPASDDAEWDDFIAALNEFSSGQAD